MLAWVSAIRGSVAYASGRGSGHGLSTSHVSGGRSAGSWASRSNRIVVPVRGCPTMKIGRVTGWAATAGFSLRHLTICRRPVRGRMTSRTAISTPRSLSRASETSPSHSRASPSRQVSSSPKSSLPANSHACSTRWSGWNRSALTLSPRRSGRWCARRAPQGCRASAARGSRGADHRCRANGRARSPCRRWRFGRCRRRPGVAPCL